MRCCIALCIMLGSILSYGADDWYLYMFVVGYVTDALDGMMARFFSASSVLGAWLDLLADKMLFAAIWLHIAKNYNNSVIWYCIIFLILREICAVILRDIIGRNHATLHVQNHGKVKTIILGIIIICTLWQQHTGIHLYTSMLWVLGVVISWGSFILYCLQYLSQKNYESI